jgi:hypothetical protein
MAQNHGPGLAEMAAVSHPARPRPDQILQRLLAGKQRGRAQVLAVQIQQVEGIEDESLIAPFRQIRLQGRKIRGPCPRLDHQFAVDDEGFGGQGAQGIRDLGPEAIGPVQPAARQQAHLLALQPRLQAIAVEFHLVQPFRPGGRRGPQGGKRGFDEIGHRRLFRAGDGGVLADAGRRLGPGRLRRFVGAFRDLFDRAAGLQRFRAFRQDVGRVGGAGGVVLGLDQQPVLARLAALAAHSDQMPAARQFLAPQLELQLALGVIAVHGNPCAAIPDDHRPRAVIALGDGAFEGAVIQRMILDMHGQAFSPATRLGPLVTAQLFSTPSISSRRS